jgi:two-component system response regulator PilR (NtrC family)
VANLLIVDDELSILQLFQLALQKQNHTVDIVSSGSSAIEKIKKNYYDLVVTDLSMPEMDGMELIKKIREITPETIVILMTAYGSTKIAVEAMKLGAHDYLTKPLQLDDLQKTIQNAMSKAELLRQNEALRKVTDKGRYAKTLVGVSESFQKVVQWIDQVCKTTSSVLILGESGTGKELVAREVHFKSDRSESPFVAVNCAAIPQHLMESELFGYDKGAFTGADKHRIGFFEAAHRGTIFLDEIGELPLTLQTKLLRVLAERKVVRLGSTREIPVDIRLVSATNQSLEKMIAAGTFREDLFYRLNVLQIQLPALRERKEDIPILAEYFLKQYVDEYRKKIAGFQPAAMEALIEYQFPGNIRELVNIVEQSVVLEETDNVQLKTLPDKVRKKGKAREITQEISPDFSLEKEVDHYERAIIMKALEKAKGVKTQAAKILKISFRSLRYRLERLGLDSADDETPDDR